MTDCLSESGTVAASSRVRASCPFVAAICVSCVARNGTHCTARVCAERVCGRCVSAHRVAVSAAKARGETTEEGSTNDSERAHSTQRSGEHPTPLSTRAPPLLPTVPDHGPLCLTLCLLALTSFL